MIYKKSGEIFVIGLYDGEKIIQSLKRFLKEEKIKSGFFWAIGGVKNPEIGIYEIQKNQFIKKSFNGIFEVVSFHGNASIDPDEINPVIHAHISIVTKDFSVIGGHLVESEVAVAYEMVFIPTQNPIVREWNQKYKVMLWEYL